jgi:hypothetical protein
MTIRLARHDEIVERMALGIVDLRGWGHMDGTNRQKWAREDATAALDALLTAVVEMGVGRGAFGWRMAAGEWHAETEEQQHEFPALIIQLEDKP